MGFESYHPVIPLICFLSVITAAASCRHPVFLVISCFGAFACCVRHNGRKAVVFGLCLIPAAVLFALFYSGYHHFGVTVLGQNAIGNNLTVESFLCGLTLGAAAAAVCMWMSCVFSVFTEDKIVYLFGRVSPRLSLFASVLLRLVPRLKAQAGKLSAARSAVGRGAGQGSPFRRIINSVSILSALTVWLPEALTTVSDSMNSRGYSLKGRTAYSLYRFDNRDRGLVIVLFTCITLVLMGAILGQTAITFDPQIRMAPVTGAAFVFYTGYAVMCMMPVGLDLWAEFHFRCARSVV